MKFLRAAIRRLVTLHPAYKALMSSACSANARYGRALKRIAKLEDERSGYIDLRAERSNAIAKLKSERNYWESEACEWKKRADAIAREYRALYADRRASVKNPDDIPMPHEGQNIQ